MQLNPSALIDLIKESAGALTAVAAAVAAWMGLRKRRQHAPAAASAHVARPVILQPAAVGVAQLPDLNCTSHAFSLPPTQTPLPRWLTQTMTLVILAFFITAVSSVVTLRDRSRDIESLLPTTKTEAKPVTRVPISIFVDHSQSLRIVTQNGRIDPLLVSGIVRTFNGAPPDSVVVVFASDAVGETLQYQRTWYHVGQTPVQNDGTWKALLSLDHVPPARRQPTTMSLLALLCDRDINLPHAGSLAGVLAHGRSDIVQLKYASENMVSRVSSSIGNNELDLVYVNTGSPNAQRNEGPLSVPSSTRHTVLVGTLGSDLRSATPEAASARLSPQTSVTQVDADRRQSAMVCNMPPP